MGGSRSHFRPRCGRGPPLDSSSQHALLPAPGRIPAKFRRLRRLQTAASSSVLLWAPKWLSWLRVPTVPPPEIHFEALQPELLIQDTPSALSSGGWSSLRRGVIEAFEVAPGCPFPAWGKESFHAAKVGFSSPRMCGQNQPLIL